MLLREAVGAFEGRELRVFADCMLGLGGHSGAILAEHPEVSTFVGVDKDPVALEIARERLQGRASRGAAGKFHEKPLERMTDDWLALSELKDVPTPIESFPN